MIAMSPSVTRTRAARGELLRELSRRVARRIDDASGDPAMQEFLKRIFRSNDVRGRA
jgi:hypothetical protein